MIYFLALLPATALTIAGYFVLYLASRSEGGLRTFGRYLAFWAFTLAGLVVLGAIFAAAHGHGRWRGMHEHCPWGAARLEGPREPPPPGAPPLPAAPGAADSGSPPAATH
jgi:hypothetical protein